MCEVERICPMRGRWDPVNEAIHQALTNITLADMQEASLPRPVVVRPAINVAE
jgi:DNA-binding IscR family transcriptional regulator